MHGGRVKVPRPFGVKSLTKRDLDALLEARAGESMMVQPYRMDITFEQHKREHEDNFVLVVGCLYCKPEIDRLGK
jgi:hypothetical protein